MPERKQVYRIMNDDGSFFGADVVTLQDESAPDRMIHPSQPHSSLALNGLEKKPLLSEVFGDGKRITKPKTVMEIRDFSQNRLQKLTNEYKRFENPHIYKVGLSNQLKEVRDNLINQHKKRT